MVLGGRMNSSPARVVTLSRQSSSLNCMPRPSLLKTSQSFNVDEPHISPLDDCRHVIIVRPTLLIMNTSVALSKGDAPYQARSLVSSLSYRRGVCHQKCRWRPEVSRFAPTQDIIHLQYLVEIHDIVLVPRLTGVLRTVSTTPTPGKSVRRVQLPRICKAKNTRCIPGTST